MDKFKAFIEPLIETSDYNVIPLAGDASTRRYYRIVAEKKSWVLMQWESFENISDFPFLSVQKYFHDNEIRVPHIHHFSKKDGLFLLEDLGDLTLERRFWEFQNQETVLPFYKKTLDQLIKIHSLSFKNDDASTCTALANEFSVEKLLWEMNYAKKHLLNGLLKINLDSEIDLLLTKEFLSLCEELYQSPQVICHRDFHSRNVMLSYNDLVIIDFQDARMGPPAYDLVSLFCDSYVNLSTSSINQLMVYYKKQFPFFERLNLNEKQWQKFYDLQTVQRCFKACGSFSSFKMTRDDDRYIHYIAPTLKRVVEKLNELSSYPTLTKLLGDSQKTWEAL